MTHEDHLVTNDPIAATEIEREQRDADRSDEALQICIEAGLMQPGPATLDCIANKRASVWRIKQAGRSIIAKRQPLERAQIEELVYAQILSQLPIPTLRFHFLAPSKDPGTAWLFLDDAGEQEPSFADPESRLRAGEWLGTIHSAEISTDALRSVAPETELANADLAAERMRASRANSALRPATKSAVSQLISMLEQASGASGRIAAACAVAARCFVHTDLKTTNLRFDRGARLVAFDWEHAAIGPPGSDLWSVYRSPRYAGPSRGVENRASVGHAKWSRTPRIEPDLTSYVTTMRRRWPEFDVGAASRLGLVGELFRAINGLRWEVEKLAHPWADESRASLEVYVSWLDELLLEIERSL